MGGSYTHRQTEKSSDKVPLFTILCRGLFILFFSLHSYFPKSLLTPNPIHYSKPSTKHHALCILLFIIHSFLFKKKKGGQIERERESSTSMPILLKAFASLYVYNCVLFEVAHSYHTPNSATARSIKNHKHIKKEWNVH